MTKSKPIQEKIDQFEYNLAKYKFIQSLFPDVCTFTETFPFTCCGFKSNLINKKEAKFKFNTYNNLVASMYNEITFEFNNKTEIIQIFSIPRQMTLAKKQTVIVRVEKFAGSYERVIKFCRLPSTIIFGEEFIKECSIQILNYIKINNKYRLDTKNLDPKLKKLIVFT